MRTRFWQALRRRRGQTNDQFDGNDILGKFNPGLVRRVSIWRLREIHSEGSDFVFELHYTAFWSNHVGHFKSWISAREAASGHTYYLSPGTPAR